LFLARSIRPGKDASPNHDKLTVLSFLFGGSEDASSFTVLSFVFFLDALEVAPEDELTVCIFTGTACLICTCAYLP
jgi:hypothetical protein